MDHASLFFQARALLGNAIADHVFEGCNLHQALSAGRNLRRCTHFLTLCPE
jgi:hypothetical protein